MTKFQITIDQDHLGGVLAALPFGVNPEIVRLKDGPTKKAKTNGHKPPNNRATDVSAFLADLPALFTPQDFAASMKRHGANPNSYTHFLHRAAKEKLLRKVGSGRKLQYEKVTSK